MNTLSKILAVVVALLGALVFVVEKNPEAFYIFQPAHLHDLAKRGIQAHGNDTRSVVQYIVNELHGQASTTSHINLDEEWFFNNAGGAMGGMYVIHASTTAPPVPMNGELN